MENTKENREEFAVIMWGLAEEFGGKLSKENLKMRFNALSEYSMGDVRNACNYLFTNREAKFPPVPTTQEIIEAIKRNNGAVDREVKAGLEVDKIFQKLKEWGREAKPLFYDEITKYLMTNRWTFQQLDQLTISDPGLKWFRKEFVEAYINLSRNSAVVENCLPGGVNDPDRISAKRLNLLVHAKRMED